jgi:Mycothiol maleylpyruvate isomerase N-terminal domain
VTLGFDGTLDRRVVVRAIDEVSSLVRRPEVAVAWDHESSCVGMSVGGLTRHLISQPVLVVTLLQTDPEPDAETIGLLEHYARAAWVREDLEGDTNQTIRENSDQQAAEGVGPAITVLDDALTQVDSALAAPPRSTFIPWQGWALQTDDFLVTRLMEMVVHSDDLAASVDVPAPDFGPEVLDPVLRLLTALSVRQHGQDAVVRTLTRPQRAPDTITAF